MEAGKEIDVVILAGGRGKRLREVVRDRPKPMVEINGQPFLDILINYAQTFGFGRFILCVGHMSGFIMDYYRRKETAGQISFSVENELLGTGGAVKNAEKLIGTNPFMVMNGDSFCPVNLSEFIDFHERKRAIVSMVVSRIEDSRDYGALMLDNSKKIAQYAEKKKDGGYINAGIYLFERAVFSIIPPGIKYSLEYDLFPKLVGQDFYGFPTSESMIDIGTPDRLANAEKFLSK